MRTWHEPVAMRQRPLKRATISRTITFIVQDAAGEAMWGGINEERGREVAESLADRTNAAAALLCVDRIVYKGLKGDRYRTMWTQLVEPFGTTPLGRHGRTRISPLAERELSSV